MVVPVTPATTDIAAIPLANGSIHHNASSPLDASRLSIKRSETLRAVPLPDSPEIKDAGYHTDHMLTVSWSASKGWTAPKIEPFGPLGITPTMSVLHYATTCFEGMKLYRGEDRKLRMFRPALNCERMARSATRISLPQFDPAELLKCIAQLCAIEGPRWLPPERGSSSLYIRPIMFGSNESVAVKAPDAAILCVMICFLPLTPANRPPLRILASAEGDVRAWPGGVGWAKVGVNYGPSLSALKEARDRGFMFVLWLLDREGSKAAGEPERVIEVTEVGSSNIIVVWKNKNGEREIVTPILGGDKGVILDGITRRSALELTRKKMNGKAKVIERMLDMRELVEAVQEGRLEEAFTVGTAVFVWPIAEIEYRGMSLKIPTDREDSVAKFVRSSLEDILSGRVSHEWGYVVDEHA